MATSGTSQTAGADSQYNNAGLFTGGSVNKGSNMDKESFLLLLVTQFQHQDPLNPMEDKEFIAQLAQFSTLEQSMTMNETMNNLLAAQQEQSTMGAVNYIGKEVLARGYGVSVQGDEVSTIEYSISTEVAKGYANILDANNQLVTTVELPSKGVGIHKLNWDGKTTDGSKAPDGVYTIAISCTDSDGKQVMVDTQVGGRVTAVSYYNNQQFLKMSDGRVVALSNVREVLETKTTKPDEKPDPETPKPPVTPTPPEETPTP